jgi:excisionase family DNA binding protein
MEVLQMALITVKELAEQLGVSTITIHRWKKEKGLPFKKLGYAVRFDVDEVFEWMEETNNYPKVKKFFVKIVDSETGEEKIDGFDTFKEYADFLMLAIKNKKPSQEFYIAEQMED